MTHADREHPTEMTPAEVKALLDERQIFLVDVREPAEFASERIHGAMLYPLSTFDPATLPASDLHRIVFQCGSGKRSLMALQKYRSAGARQCAHLAGGLAAWRAAGLPTVRIDPATGLVVDPARR